MKKLNSKGFTLVELLGVVAIIAILATVAITSIGGAIAASKSASAKRQAQVLTSAYQNYLAAGGTKSATVGTILTALQGTVNSGAGDIGPFLTTAVTANDLANFGGHGIAITFDENTGFTAP